MSTDPCPSDAAEVAEMYCLKKLSPEEARTFEDHYMTCSRCAQKVQKAQEFVNAIRHAARCLQDEQGKGTIEH